MKGVYIHIAIGLLLTANWRVYEAELWRVFQGTLVILFASDNDQIKGNG